MSVTTTGGGSLVPHDLNAAMQLANMMATGKLVPQHLQRSPGDCLMVIEQAIRWNMSPFAVAQCTSVIQGKLMFEGKLVAAALNSSGLLEKRLKEEFSGEGANRKVKLIGTIRGETKPRDIEISLAEAKTSNGMWIKQPDQQLIYFATRAWARRHAPEVMLGVYSPEEFDEARRPPETFAGTTIEVTAVAASQGPEVRDELSWLEQLDEKLGNEPNGTKWLKLLDAECVHVPGLEDAEAIAGLATVRAAYEKAPTMIKDRINEILRKAVARFDVPPDSVEPDFMSGEPEPR